LSGVSAQIDPLPIEPARGPLSAAIRVPGSKSLSNRHLVLAALAQGETRLRGLLACDDCDRLLVALDACGVAHRIDQPSGDVIITGGVGRLPRGASVNLGDGGTPTRFMLALAACADGETIVDGSARMRERPVAEGVELLRALGADIAYTEAAGRLPVRIRGGTLRGGTIEVGRTASSQFVSALMLVAPALADGIDIRFTEEPTSASYLELSLAALAAAGVHAEITRGPVLLSAATVGGGCRFRASSTVTSSSSPCNQHSRSFRHTRARAGRQTKGRRALPTAAHSSLRAVPWRYTRRASEDPLEYAVSTPAYPWSE
jgi:3-phosphoshikimate 1-carboxyvinyltransferase